MGAQQKQVGGGSATPVAQGFNDFLMQQLTGGTQTAQTAQLQQAINQMGQNSVTRGLVPQLQSELTRQQSNLQQPNQQTQAFGNLFAGQSAGQTPDQTGSAQMLQQLFSQLGGGGNMAGLFNPVQMQQSQLTMDSPIMQQMGDFNEVMRQRAVADQRARFGAEGAGSLGTGAQFAEGTLNADFAGRNAATMQQIFAQQQAQDLAERQAQAGMGLQGQGQGLQGLMQLLGMGQQQNQFGAGQQANLLQMLMGGMQQSNQLGTPQSQIVSQPSPWGQIAGAGLGLGGALLGGPLGGRIFGGAGGGMNIPQPPNVNIPNVPIPDYRPRW